MDGPVFALAVLGSDVYAGLVHDGGGSPQIHCQMEREQLERAGHRMGGVDPFLFFFPMRLRWRCRAATWLCVSDGGWEDFGFHRAGSSG
jgi:hypothetical protein